MTTSFCYRPNGPRRGFSCAPPLTGDGRMLLASWVEVVDERAQARQPRPTRRER